MSPNWHPTNQPPLYPPPRYAFFLLASSLGRWQATLESFSVGASTFNVRYNLPLIIESLSWVVLWFLGVWLGCLGCGGGVVCFWGVLWCAFWKVSFQYPRTLLIPPKGGPQFLLFLVSLSVPPAENMPLPSSDATYPFSNRR